jgi:phosphatidylethanolamine/phosphatidyl-N-methylethanolamine N-methyltransferase
MRMTNRWNRFIYRVWAPVYDALLERLFGRGRRRAMEVAAPTGKDRLCFVGIGTGTDLLLLPSGVEAVGVDLSEAMLARAHEKLPIPGCEVALLVGDAEALPFDDADGPFDIVMLNLILSVVPDARRCLAEALRVARPGGRIVVFDKFLPDHTRPSPGRMLTNVVSTLFGTDINRRLGDIVTGAPCRIVHDEPSILGGMYRVVVLEKRGDRPEWRGAP